MSEYVAITAGIALDLPQLEEDGLTGRFMMCFFPEDGSDPVGTEVECTQFELMTDGAARFVLPCYNAIVRTIKERSK